MVMDEKIVGTAVFDLDDTLAEGVWPLRGVVGEPIPEGIALLKTYADAGYLIVVDTARRAWDKPLVIDWVKKHKLPVNIVRCGKKFAADVYVDDKALRFERGNVTDGGRGWPEEIV